MDRDRKPGLVFWTPAPAGSSSSELSDDEEQGDFHSQMDENGIIGLEHALDDTGLGRYKGGRGPRNDCTAPPGPSGQSRQEPQIVSHSNDVRNLEMQGNDLDKDFRQKEEENRENPRRLLTGDMSPCSPVPLDWISKHYCPEHQPAFPFRALGLPLLLSSKELAASPAIEDETLPETGLSESPSESHSSCRSNPCPEKPIPCVSPKPAAETRTLNHCSGVSKIPVKVSLARLRPLPEDVHLSSTSLRKCRAGSFKSSCQTKHSPDRKPRTTTVAAKAPQFRKDSQNVRRPDFSKVEPRVRFPKDGYSPPKSMRSLKRDSLSHEHPLVFKSPADIVKEVLLEPVNGTDPLEGATSSSAPLSIVPPDFRCKQQATALMDELQEDNYRLKIKCAEAENTIDRLRLEGRVNLYSDPPKPGLALYSGLSVPASKPMTLDIHRVQRAEFTSASPDQCITRHRRSPALSSSSTSSSRSSNLADRVYKHSGTFLQEVEAFQQILQNGKLNFLEQKKGLSQLIRRLDSLERDYLLAKDEHKLLQQHGAEIGSFDPGRELEGLVFQCGLHIDKLKEQVQSRHQEPPTCQARQTRQAPPTPPGQATPPLIYHGREELQCLPSLILSGSEPAASIEDVSSSSEEGNNQTLKPFSAEPLKSNYRNDEPDLTKLYQSFKMLHKPLVRDLWQDTPLSADSRTNSEPEDVETRRLSMPYTEEQESSPIKKAVPPCAPSAKHSPTPLSHRPSSKMSEVGPSHSSSLSSLRDNAAPERKDNKPNSGRQRVLSQEGVISPETDSGFLGSESCHLTPATDPSPVHQRAHQGVSGNPPVDHPCSVSSANRHANEGLRVRAHLMKRSRKGKKRRTLSASYSQQQKHRPSQRAAESESSESRLNSDHTHTVSEEDQSDHFTQSIQSPHSPSPAAFHHHENPLRDPCSSRVAKPNEALQMLQAEVSQLKDKMESYVSNTVRAERNYPNTSTPSVRSERQRVRDVRGRRERKRDEEPESDLFRRSADKKRSVTTHIQQTHSSSEGPRSCHQLSRFTQTSDVETSHRKTRAVQSRSHLIVGQSSETTAEAECGHSRAPVCPQCLSERGQSKHGVIKDETKTPNHSLCSHHCPLCGRPESDLFHHRSTQTSSSSNSAERSIHSTVHHVPVCPPSLLLYAYPPLVHLSPTKSEGPPRVRGHRKERSRRSLSAERESSLDRSLDKALRAARSMKHTSKHMAHSLASGLHHHRLLAHTR